MKYNCSSDISWTTGIKATHEIYLELDLEISEILHSAFNIEIRFQALESQIRHEVFTLCVEQIVPPIIQDTGVNAHTDGDLHVDTHSKVHNQAQVRIPTRDDTSLYIRDKMHLRMTLVTDRSVNAIQALSATRGGLAAEITNEVMRLLKIAVLNVDDKSVGSSWSVSENTVESFAAKVKKSSADGN